MFIFRVLWVLLSVGIRMAVVVTPFIYFYEHNGTLPSFAVPTGIPTAVMLPVYSVLAFVLLFWREIVDGAAQQQEWLAQLSDEERGGYFRRKEEEAEAIKRQDDDRTFDRLTPGTAGYYIDRGHDSQF